MKKNLQRLLLVGLLALVALSARAATVHAADARWEARYWNNRDLSGDPVLERKEDELNHDWGNGSPKPGVVNDDNFSARWKRTIDVSGGTYRFTATMDDGMRVWVDGDLIIDSWFDGRKRTVTVDRFLPAGEHELRVRYYDRRGEAVAKLKWTKLTSNPDNPFPWRGEYFNNRNLSGTPAFTRLDDRINFDWGGGAPAPGVSADHFSVRWTREVNLEPGRYRFTVRTDDGVRLWVNNQLLIDRWIDQAPTSYSAEITLPGGFVPVRMEYYEGDGHAEAHLSRVQVGGAPPLFSEWRGEYFNNRTLSGSPVFQRNDPVLSFNWGNGSPGAGIPSDNFSVRWTRDVNLNPGRYRFTAVSDDGMRVWVNGQLLINAWSDHATQFFTGDITLPGGVIPLRVEYYDNSGLAEARLTWTAITDFPVVPAPSPAQPVATVATARLNVRSGPSTSFGVITQVSQGDTLQLLARNADSTWVNVVIPNGTQGWVFAPLISTGYSLSNLPTVTSSGPVSPAPTGTGTVSVFRLNVRSNPFVTNDNIITKINRGSTVQLLGRNATSTWLWVRIPDGRQGWVFAPLVRTTQNLSALPVR